MNTPQILRSDRVLFAFFLFTILSGTIFAQTTQLPLDFYTSKLTPVQVQPWLDPVSGNAITIDAYNKRNTFFNLGLPTVSEGRVMIQSLKDNMQQVIVDGHTRNAFCVGTSNNGLAFGYGLNEVRFGGRTAALGNVNYRIVFAPQPASQPFNVNGELEFFSASVQCDGPLRAGSGFAEGTLGFAQTRQTGILGANPIKECPPEQNENCFPAEKVQFKPRD